MMRIIAAVPAAAGAIFQFVGALSFLLYGMKMMSEGVQKSAGNSLRRVLNFITGNRVMAVLTGMFVTCVIQSSSAATVMIVSFVNSGLLSLTQAIGAIFGANIGTTLTAWIVSLFGFKFKIAVFAIPVFGVGFLLTNVKKFRKKEIGQALMGFGLLFLGLEWLGDAIPKLDENTINSFLSRFSGSGLTNLLVGILAGTVITIILDSSSAVTAIIITMAYNGLLTWEFSAALVLGSNIGTTSDVLFASAGASANAKRAAFVHVFFNVAGSVIAACSFRPFITLVDFLTPGTVTENIALHIAMFHTIFNVTNTLLFLPFVKPLARLTEKIIPAKGDELPADYRFDFRDEMKENAEGALLSVEHEITQMTGLVRSMFARIEKGLAASTEEGASSGGFARFIDDNENALASGEDYIDKMRTSLSAYLLRCYELPLNEENKKRIPLLVNIVNELERMSDDCYSFAMLMKKSVEKEMRFKPKDLARLVPYTARAGEFLDFIGGRINKSSGGEWLDAAREKEEGIDKSRKALKKLAAKRLRQGADVKQELLYIDMVRSIEKIGDSAYAVARNLAKMS